MKIEFDYSTSCPQNLFKSIKILGDILGYEKLIFVSDNDFPTHRKFEELVPVVCSYPLPFFVQKSNSKSRVDEGVNTSKIWDVGKTICYIEWSR